MSITSFARPRTELVVADKFTGSELDRIPVHRREDVGALLARGVEGSATAAALPRHERARILADAAAALEQRSEEAASLIVAEAGKTIRQARKEVSRAVNTLRLSGHEALRNVGEVVPFDSFPGAGDRTSWFTREPLGLILAITPYNDPLNLVAHKLGPALAAGDGILVKPSELAPLSARLLVRLLVDAGLPEKVITMVHGDRTVTADLVASDQVRLVSFTGGFATAEAITRIAGIKRLAMELGGNAPVLVFEDADISAAVESCTSAAFWAAGQNCIGAQRILVERSRYDAFLAGMVTATGSLVVGDPADERTDVGPMISSAAAEAALARVAEAVAAGAQVVAGGRARGAVLEPTILTGTPRDCALWREEAFAPVVVVEPFDTEADAIALANDSAAALQAGLFTRDIGRALRVASAIRAGGVMINDSSDVRLDAMPFGGAGFGSMGREGVRFAYEELTQPKVVAITR